MTMHRGEHWTRKAVGDKRSARIVQHVEIIRTGPPRKGKCYFDRDGLLVYVVKSADETTHVFHCRRVLVNGNLSREVFEKEWDYEKQEGATNV